MRAAVPEGNRAAWKHAKRKQKPNKAGCCVDAACPPGPMGGLPVDQPSQREGETRGPDVGARKALPRRRAQRSRPRGASPRLYLARNVWPRSPGSGGPSSVDTPSTLTLPLPSPWAHSPFPSPPRGCLQRQRPACLTRPWLTVGPGH